MFKQNSLITRYCLAAAVMLVACGSVYGVSDSNLVAHWEFDEGAGTIAHDSVGNNHGTIDGAQWTTGIVGGALNFDGINDYVEVPNNESQQIKTNQLTVTTWIKLDEDVGNIQRKLICKLQTPMVSWGLSVYGNGYCGATGNQVEFSDSNGSTWSV